MVTQYAFWFDVSGVIFDESFGSDFSGGFSQWVELEKFAEGVDDNKYYDAPKRPVGNGP
jgi:hypothetical protein